MARACVFCGDLRQSKEHVYPKWLRKLMGKYYGAITIVTTEEGTTGRRSQAPFDVTINTVCKPCNTGWMHQLEDQARPVLGPMIKGQPCQLNVTEQANVARWFAKTTLMMHEQAKSASRIIPAEHFQAAYKRHRPPEGTVIWLGAQTEPLDGPVSAVYSAIDKQEISASSDQDLPAGSRFYSAGFVVGGLGFMLLANCSGTTSALPAFPEVSPYLLQIWPTLGAQAWPPRLTDDLGGFQAFYEGLFGT